MNIVGALLGRTKGATPYTGAQTTGAAFVDAFNKNRAPNPNELIRENLGTAYACQTLNADLIASTRIGLYVKTRRGESKSRLSKRGDTKPISQKTFERLSRTCAKSISDATDVQEVTTHPSLDILQSPNDPSEDGVAMDGFSLFNLTQSFQEIVGRCYWYVERDGIGETPSAIWILAPQRVQEMPGFNSDSKIIAWYQFSGGANGKQRYEVSEVIPFRMPDLFNVYTGGTPPLRAVFEQVKLGRKVDAHTNATLDNGGRPSAIITPAPNGEMGGFIGPAEAERLQRSLRTAFGRAGAGGVMVGEFAGSLQMLDWPVKDIIDAARYELSLDAICAAFGVPTTKIKRNDVNRASAQTGDYAHAKDAGLPRLKRNAAVLNQFFLPMYGPEAAERLFFAYDDPEGLQDPDAERLEFDSAEKTGAVTRNDRRLRLGLESVTWGDQPLAPNNMTAVDPATGKPEVMVNPFTSMFGAPKADATGDAVPPQIDTIQTTQETVLNGAQVTAATAIVTAVVAGQMPRDAGIGQLMVLFNLSKEQAEQIMGSAGTSTPTTPNPNPAREAELQAAADANSSGQQGAGGGAKAGAGNRGVDGDAKGVAEQVGANVPNPGTLAQAAQILKIIADTLATKTEADDGQSGTSNQGTGTVPADSIASDTASQGAGAAIGNSDATSAKHPTGDGGAGATVLHGADAGDAAGPTDSVRAIAGEDQEGKAPDGAVGANRAGQANAGKTSVVVKAPELISATPDGLARPLPQGVEIQAKLQHVFEQQRAEVLSQLAAHYHKSRRKTETDASKLPTAFIPLTKWDATIAAECRPLIEVIARNEGRNLLTQVGASPEVFAVFEKNIPQAAQDLTLKFAESTNATTTMQLDEALAKLRTDIGEGLVEGDTRIELTKRVQAVFDQADKVRAEMIARTEGSRAAHTGELMGAKESGVVSKKFWLASVDACEEICLPIVEANPDGVPLDGEFEGGISSPPAHPNCLIGETPVLAPMRIKAFSAKYDGPIVRIELGGGRALSVTPNHMLLTPDGFIRAASLRKGDQLIDCDWKDSATASPDDEWNPSPIKQVVASLAKVPGMMAGSVPVSPEYLHGDAVMVKGDIHVVAPDGFLRGERNSTTAQSGRESQFCVAGVNEAAFIKRRDLATMLFALRDATDGGVSKTREARSLSLARSRHPESLSIAEGATLDAKKIDRVANARTGDLVSLCNHHLGFSGKVTLANVVGVEHVQFTGHVYDLETSSTLYLANGLVSSNCQCSLTYSVRDDGEKA